MRVPVLLAVLAISFCGHATARVLEPAAASLSVEAQPHRYARPSKFATVLMPAADYQPLL